MAKCIQIKIADIDFIQQWALTHIFLAFSQGLSSVSESVTGPFLGRRKEIRNLPFSPSQVVKVVESDQNPSNHLPAI